RASSPPPPSRSSATAWNGSGTCGACATRPTGGASWSMPPRRRIDAPGRSTARSQTSSTSSSTATPTTSSHCCATFSASAPRSTPRSQRSSRNAVLSIPRDRVVNAHRGPETARSAAGRDREGPVVDDAFHHDRRGEPLHAGQRCELLVAEGLVRGDVGSSDADEVVGVSEKPLRVAHLCDLGQTPLEPRDRLRILPLHRHVHQNLEAETKHDGIDHGSISADRSPPLPLPPPRAARSAGWLDTP